MIMKNINNGYGIHEYVYNKRGQSVGVFAAVPSDYDTSVVHIGWSRANKRAGDRFDKKMGTVIAFERSRKASAAEVPASMIDHYNFFYNRCKRYFKERNVVSKVGTI